MKYKKNYTHPIFIILLYQINTYFFISKLRLRLKMNGILLKIVVEMKVEDSNYKYIIFNYHKIGFSLVLLCCKCNIFISRTS